MKSIGRIRWLALAIMASVANGSRADDLLIHSTTGNVGPREPVNKFTATDGQKLYRSICQGCHMPDGKGAKGAGIYPALAGNPKLASAAYPAYVILNGFHGMPSFAADLSDIQVAAVVNFVVTHFGNHTNELASADSVKALRPVP